MRPPHRSSTMGDRVMAMQIAPPASLAPDGTVSSDCEWGEWLREVLHQRERVFSIDPDEMVGHYFHEIGISRDYHGRELLEMLQNAADEGVGYGQPVRGVISLSPDGLCIANVGKPFVREGVKSLIVSNTSQKRLKRARYIGYKGLGFRSILNWTTSPFILSDSLSLGFDRDRARRWLDHLYALYPAVRTTVEQWRQSGAHHWPIPTLAVPALLDAHGVPMEETGAGNRQQPSQHTFFPVWSEARRLRNEGYTTVIGIPFSDEGTYAEVAKQLAQIGREVLLFAGNLQELAVRRPEGEVTWRVEQALDAEGGIVWISAVTPTGSDAQYWQIFQTTGRIPDDKLSQELRDTPDYEIKLAVPAERTAETPGVLFAYFPTKVAFPFPLVAHATLELSDNRDGLRETEANKYLIGELAELLAKAAEDTRETTDPWRSLALLAGGVSDVTLKRLGFQAALYQAAKSRNLLPVRDGSLVRPAAARRLAAQVGDWLPLPGFENIVLWPPTP